VSPPRAAYPLLLALAADARSFRLLADSDRTTRLGASIAARYIASIALAGGWRVVVVEKPEKGGAPKRSSIARG
jgi:hypothetical protein